MSQDLILRTTRKPQVTEKQFHRRGSRENIRTHTAQTHRPPRRLRVLRTCPAIAWGRLDKGSVSVRIASVLTCPRVSTQKSHAKVRGPVRDSVRFFGSTKRYRSGRNISSPPH